ncbi:MAG: dolichyl-phosphate beta-D-mannosyltransferase [Bacteroidetes bacterium CG12_big_fil_rev_8_21_14_0_65_60_17]|nr:MAG: dolichyl-phosphate beta-D-mannosyltransferase [Bacteroidetes bacterium CG12_big_fil_rev_8_21_14_0_65_60_17]
MRALVVIPTYNEAENITGIVRAVLALVPRFDVLVVDDGSPDGTGDLVEELVQAGRVHLLRREAKLGLGTAYIAGFRYALEHGYDAVCEMDADWSHNPNDLPRLLEPVARGQADLVIGSRYIGGVRIMNWPLSRLILSWSAGVYTRAITRLPVHDVTAGFKCIHRRVLEAFDLTRIRSNGYSFQIEVNYRAWKAGFRLREVPIVFTERTEGTSKMSRGIVREAAWKVWELRLRHLIRKL